MNAGAIAFVGNHGICGISDSLLLPSLINNPALFFFFRLVSCLHASKKKILKRFSTLYIVFVSPHFPYMPPCSLLANSWDLGRSVPFQLIAFLLS